MPKHKAGKELQRSGQRVLSLSKLADEANKEHAEVVKSGLSMLQHARACGNYLLQAKHAIGHGGWLSWVRDNFRATPRTAQRYMRIAERWEDLRLNATRVSDLSVRGAVKLLREQTVERERGDTLLFTYKSLVGHRINMQRQANNLPEHLAERLVRVMDELREIEEAVQGQLSSP